MAKKPKPAASRGSMPRVQALLTCDGIALDPTSKKATLYGLFDQIMITESPAKAQFAVYAKLRGGNGTHKLKLQLFTPTGKPIDGLPPEFEVAFEPEATIEMQLMAAGVPLVEGEHKLQFSLNGKALGEAVSLFVKKIKKQ